MFVDVALPYTASVLTKMMLWVPSSTEPPVSQRQPLRGMALNGAVKRKMRPKESSALIQKMQGKSRVAPQFGPHFCTSTSNTAKHTAPVPPAISVIARWRGRLPFSF